MLIFDATTKSLEFKLGGIVTTNQAVFTSMYVDHTSTTYVPGTQNGVSSDTTAVTIVSAPGASTQRSLKYCNIYNRDTVPITVTVQYNDNATIREMLVVTLAVKDTLQFIDTEGWAVIDTNGQKKSIASLAAGTNVIGHVIADSGSTTAVTGTVTISGTVTANAGTNLNTSALALETTATSIKTAVEIIDNAIAGTEMQVDVLTVPAPLSTTGGGTEATALRVTVASDSTGVLSVDDNGGSLTIDGTVTASNTSGDVASDGVDSGNPVKIGYQARTSDITAVANADRVNGIADTLGKAVVLLGSLHAQKISGTANFTTTTGADVIAAQGVGIKTVVTGILVGNNHATVGTKVSIRDGTTVKLVCTAQPLGGGFGLQNAGGIFVSTANTAITAICGTTGADVDVSIQGYTITN